MKIVLFVHSIISDWNKGHAPFLRSLVTVLETIRHRHHCDLRVGRLEDICQTLTVEGE